MARDESLSVTFKPGTHKHDCLLQLMKFVEDNTVWFTEGYGSKQNTTLINETTIRVSIDMGSRKK